METRVVSKEEGLVTVVWCPFHPFSSVTFECIFFIDATADAESSEESDEEMDGSCKCVVPHHTRLLRSLLEVRD